MVLLHCCGKAGNRGVHSEIPIVSIQAVCQYALLELSVISLKSELQK